MVAETLAEDCMEILGNPLLRGTASLSQLEFLLSDAGFTTSFTTALPVLKSGIFTATTVHAPHGTDGVYTEAGLRQLLPEVTSRAR